jgi:hypothetical protein
VALQRERRFRRPAVPGGSIGTITGTAGFTCADANNAQFEYTVQLSGMPCAVTQPRQIMHNAQFQYTVQLNGMPSAVNQPRQIMRLLVEIAPQDRPMREPWPLTQVKASVPIAVYAQRMRHARRTRDIGCAGD